MRLVRKTSKGGGLCVFVCVCTSVYVCVPHIWFNRTLLQQGCQAEFFRPRCLSTDVAAPGSLSELRSTFPHHKNLKPRKWFRKTFGVRRKSSWLKQALQIRVLCNTRMDGNKSTLLQAKATVANAEHHGSDFKRKAEWAWKSWGGQFWMPQLRTQLYCVFPKAFSHAHIKRQMSSGFAKWPPLKKKTQPKIL